MQLIKSFLTFRIFVFQSLKPITHSSAILALWVSKHMMNGTEVEATTSFTFPFTPSTHAIPASKNLAPIMASPILLHLVIPYHSIVPPHDFS